MAYTSSFHPLALVSTTLAGKATYTSLYEHGKGTLTVGVLCEGRTNAAKVEGFIANVV